ncbi:MAG: MCP four helix bundle domain-containing protein [Pseudomonadota bacterium]
MITPPHAKRLPKRMSQMILLGFAVLIGLMTVLVVNSVRALRAQEDRLIEMVETRNRKIQLATDLLNATHSRHNSLTYQVFVEDPFEQDEHFQQYIKWGFEVGKARNALREMPLDSFEGESLARQDRLIEVIVDLHDRISDLARQGRQAEARALISGTLRPYNLEFTSSVSQLEQYERELNQRAFEATRQAGQRASALNIGLGVTLLLLSLVIAWITYRLMSR